jgi:hypothetical protein
MKHMPHKRLNLTAARFPLGSLVDFDSIGLSDDQASNFEFGETIQ